MTELGTELNDTSEDLALVGALGVVVTFGDQELIPSALRAATRKRWCVPSVRSQFLDQAAPEDHRPAARR